MVEHICADSVKVARLEERVKNLEERLLVSEEERKKALLLIRANPPAFPLVITGSVSDAVKEAFKFFGPIKSVECECTIEHKVQELPWFCVNHIRDFEGKSIPVENIMTETEEKYKKPVLVNIIIAEWNHVDYSLKIPLHIERDEERLVITINRLCQTTDKTRSI